jgi:hypothetical protein
MTIIDDRGTPLPDGHPLKETQSILGGKRPESPSTVSTDKLELPPEEGPGPTTKQGPKG